MMPLSDVDVSVTLSTPGSVTLNFDKTIYQSTQPAGAGPIWIAEVDGSELPDRVTIGPTMSSISTGIIKAGIHRVRPH